MIRKLISGILMFLTVQTVSAQKNELSLLNGRFSFVFPDNAKNSARPTDIMSADHDPNEETRVIYDIGDQRMVFFAEEMRAQSHENPELKIRQSMHSSSAPSVKTLFEKDSVSAVLITPSEFNKDKKAIVINSLVIKNPDNGLSRVTVYLNPEAYKHKADFDKIVDQVFASFKKGSRRIDLHARTVTFPILDSKSKIQLSLPENYIVNRNGKYDFEVYSIQKVREYEDDTTGTLIIYFGSHPSLFSNEYQLTDSKTTDTDGEFMLQKIKWMNFNDDKRHLLVREQVFDDDDIEKGAEEHIAMIADNPRTIEDLTAIVKNILLKYDK